MKVLKYSVISKINIGDVFISDSIEFLDSKLNEREVISKDILGKSFNVEARIKGATPNSTYSVKGYSRWLSFTVLQVKRLMFFVLQKKAFEKEIINADTIIIGGGNLLMESNGVYLFQASCDIASIARKHKKRVIVYGVGTGPFEFSYKKRLARLINNSDIFFVRDNKSRELCLKSSDSLTTDVNVSFDPAFIISDIVPLDEKIVKAPAFIGFNFMNFHRLVPGSGYEVDRVIENLVLIGKHYNLPIKIINTSFGEDLSLSLNIKNELKIRGLEAVICNILKLEDLNNAFTDLKFFVCSRMHSSIFSMSFGVPTLIYPWHNKVSSLQELLFEKDRNKVLLESVNFDSKEIIRKIDEYPTSQLKQAIEIAKEKIWMDYAQIK